VGETCSIARDGLTSIFLAVHCPTPLIRSASLPHLCKKKKKKKKKNVTCVCVCCAPRANTIKALTLKSPRTRLDLRDSVRMCCDGSSRLFNGERKIGPLHLREGVIPAQGEKGVNLHKPCTRIRSWDKEEKKGDSFTHHSTTSTSRQQCPHFPRAGKHFDSQPAV
jgi:hypothetical protein